MDRFLYISMTGAKETLRAQTVEQPQPREREHDGLSRRPAARSRARAVAGSGYASRAYATNATVGWDASQGALMSTGRDLDVGVQGAGWIAVQGADGREAYTRAGDLRIDPSGLLMNGAGQPVLGEGGPISVPPHTSLMIGADGTISIVPLGQGPETTLAGRSHQAGESARRVARARRRRSVPHDRRRRCAGRMRTCGSPPACSSRATSTSPMRWCNMIELSRHFDLQVKAMRTAEENAAAAAQLLRSVNRAN